MKTNNIWIAGVVLIVLSLLITGCVQNTQGYVTKTQINQFLAEKNITPLVIKTVENSTVILYETRQEVGMYYLSIDDNSKMSVTQTIPGYDPSSPVLISCEGSLVAVVINDNNILKKAYKVTVTYEDKYDVTELINNRRALLIVPGKIARSANVSNYSVIIRDNEDKVLFSSTTA